MRAESNFSDYKIFIKNIEKEQAQGKEWEQKQKQTWRWNKGRRQKDRLENICHKIKENSKNLHQKMILCNIL